MNTIPDHVGREAVRLLNENFEHDALQWPACDGDPTVITVAKLLMNPPAPMTDPDEEAAKRVIAAWLDSGENFARATEQMRLERQAWEAGR